jgi:hypothetical protein
MKRVTRENRQGGNARSLLVSDEVQKVSMYCTFVEDSLMVVVEPHRRIGS